MADDELYVVPGRWLKDMERVRRKVDNMTLGGRVEFSNTPTSISGHVRPSPPQPTVRPSAEMVVVRLTGFSGLGIGKYYGRIRIRPADETNLQNSSNLSGLPGTEPAADNALCLHLKEMGGATRILAVGNYCVGIVWGRDDSGKTLVVLSDVPVQICS